MKETNKKRGQAILDKLTEINKEQESLTKELKSLLTIKEGDKVKVMSVHTNQFLRFAFLWKIEINPRGKDRKCQLEFNITKAKADGSISKHRDYLSNEEYLQSKDWVHKETAKEVIHTECLRFAGGTGSIEYIAPKMPKSKFIKMVQDASSNHLPANWIKQRMSTSVNEEALKVVNDNPGMFLVCNSNNHNLFVMQMSTIS